MPHHISKPRNAGLCGFWGLQNSQHSTCCLREKCPRPSPRPQKKALPLTASAFFTPFETRSTRQHKRLVLQVFQCRRQARQPQQYTHQQRQREPVAEEARAQVHAEQCQARVEDGEQHAQFQDHAAFVEVEEHVEQRHEHHLDAHADQVDVEQRQVVAGDADPLQQAWRKEEQQHHRKALDFADFQQALANGQGHFGFQRTDVLQGLAIADGTEQAVVPLGKIGLDAHQEHGHARDDRQVGNEDRHVVQDRRTQRADHGVGGARVEPEQDLVDPDAEVVEKPGDQQAEEDVATIEEIEGNHFLGAILAQDVVQVQEQQAAVPDQQREQQPGHLQEAQQVGARDHQRIAHHHHQQDAVIFLHPREEDDHQPQVAQHHEVREHQHAVDQRLIEQQRQHDDTQHAGADRDHQQDAQQVGQDLVVVVLEQLVGHKASEEQLQAARQDQRAGHQVCHRDQELSHQRVRQQQAQADDPHQHHADDRQHPWSGADQTGIHIGMQGGGV